MIMGVETPIPPVMMNAVAPGGAPPRRIMVLIIRPPETQLALPCLGEALRQGRLGYDFSDVGFNLLFFVLELIKT